MQEEYARNFIQGKNIRLCKLKKYLDEQKDIRNDELEGTSKISTNCKNQYDVCWLRARNIKANYQNSNIPENYYYDKFSVIDDHDLESFVLCLSMKNDDYLFKHFSSSSYVKITDITKFIRLIDEAAHKKLGSSIKVLYKKITYYDELSKTDLASDGAFLKRKRYDFEAEYRILIRNHNLKQDDYIFLDIQKDEDFPIEEQIYLQ
jgi:hypothetical protein